MKKAGGLCEDCWAKGIATPAEEVHHIKKLTPANIKDESVTLNWDNLVALCHDCHTKRHHPHERRYIIDEYGRVMPK